jgi:hypothetical protein
MVAYHLVNGYEVTWKYLFDTKTLLSIVPIIIFLGEDDIRRRLGSVGWYTTLVVITTLVLASGERKAYLLLLVLFVLSRERLFTKALAIAAATAVVAWMTLIVAPEGYVAKQVRSALEPEQQMSISEYYLIESIGDQSNLIRDFVNQMAWERFLENPVLGLGAGGYYNWTRETFGADGDANGLSMNVHGEVNRIPAESGLLGIVIGVWLVASLAMTVRYRFIAAGGWGGRSADRWPLYVFAFLLIYTAYEASDTLMLTMIVGFSFEMARWPKRIALSAAT